MAPLSLLLEYEFCWVFVFKIQRRLMMVVWADMIQFVRFTVITMAEFETLEFISACQRFFQDQNVPCCLEPQPDSLLPS